MVKITKEWDEFLEEEFSSKSYLELREFLKTEYSTKTIYPDMFNIFNCMKLTSLQQVKVVILGQDPYHEEGQAMGLAFSVPKEKEVPPSLKNIYKELATEYPNFIAPNSGDLTSWATQGVLLLNAVLSISVTKSELIVVGTFNVVNTPLYAVITHVSSNSSYS